MSTKKITALTELSAAPAATDMIPVVDVSDTTDAATGTTKKITALNIGKGIGIGAGNTTAEPVKIDTSNARLGVGTASPASDLHISDAEPTITFTDETNNTDGTIQLSDNGEMIIATDVNDERSSSFIALRVDGGGVSDEKVRIDANGKVGMGATSPISPFHVANSDFTASLERFPGADSSGPGINFLKSRGSTVGAFTVVSDGDVLGDIMFKGADGNSWALAAHIRAQVDGTPGDGDMPGRLVFQTTADGAEAVTERMRIDSKGNMLLGGTATPASSVGNLCLFNGTAPAASVTNGVVLYAQDVSTSELKVRDEAGNIATLSPHNFELLGERSDPMAWSYAAKNVFVGKEVAVDMMKVIRALEKLTGEEYIKIKDIAKSERLDWDEEEKRKEGERKSEIDAYKAKKAEHDAQHDTHPTDSSTKAEIKSYLDKNKIQYEDASKDELFELVPDKPQFIDTEPAAYTKKSKPSWIG